MIQYVLTKADRGAVSWIIAVGIATAKQTYYQSIKKSLRHSSCASNFWDIPILMPLLLWEDFCQLLCHALSEYGGINNLALRVDEVHGRKPGNLVILGNLGFLPLFELAVLLPFHTVCLSVVVEFLLVGIHGYADELGTGAVLLEHLLDGRNLSAAIRAPGSPEVQYRPCSLFQGRKGWSLCS